MRPTARRITATSFARPHATAFARLRVLLGIAVLVGATACASPTAPQSTHPRPHSVRADGSPADTTDRSGGHIDPNV
jgi:hypothetical protein